MKQKTPYAIVGNGRVATHFKRYLELSGMEVLQWSRSQNTSSPVMDLQSAAIILLLIKDDAIASFLKQWPALRQKTLVHFSGALTLKGVVGLHPLQTFGPRLYSLARYQKIPFVVEGGDFNRIFPRLKNPHYRIAAADKALYHALIVMACSGSMLLWKKLFSEFAEKLALPPSVAFPILQQTATNLMRDPALPLSGPFARRDVQTMEKNLRALKGDPYAGIYQKFKALYFREGSARP